MSNAGKTFGVKSTVKTFANGDFIEIEAFDYVYLLTATGALEISGDGNNYAPFPLKRGYAPRDGSLIGRVYIRNSSGGAVTATIVTGFGRLFDNSDSSSGGSTIDVNLAAVGAVTVPTSLSSGQVAHDAPAAGNPVHVGGEAVATERAAVNAGDIARIALDLAGRQLTAPFAPVGDRVGASVAIAVVGVVDLLPAAGAGLRNHLTTLIVGNEAATVNTLIVLDGATELFRVTVPPNDSRVVTFEVPEHTAANTALRINVTAATAMRARARGYKGA